MELFSDIFYLLISSFENLSNWISRFPFALKVTSTIDNKLKWSEKTLVDVTNAKGTLRKVSPDLKRYHSINNFSKMNTYKIEKGAIIEKRCREKNNTNYMFIQSHSRKASRIVFADLFAASIRSLTFIYIWHKRIELPKNKNRYRSLIHRYSHVPWNRT